ncbi:hypothetical protein RY831_02190 [Noviherbaspirillum sp. CPCC 100848]|uniref:ESPR domain-containing protein n=1 Tax=Noviherbaspirillum album TaxID=3080276 RepID=A0ABU6J2W1_9BURK|nr:hypothetical protein [Noviherbaspirillum sp. CPCC 100848]MEC4717949.1 hypothetical protein [Noviherbaspirillum sp. CPCC 100848]
MKNPWTSKNPFLSMWLSGANAVLGSARGRASAQAKRQASTAITKASKQMGELWLASMTPPSAPKRKKRKRA